MAAAIGLRNVEYIFYLVDADAGVYFRYLAPKLFAISFYETARDDQPFEIAGLFELGHLKNRVNRFLARRIDEAARVDDQHVRGF